MSGRRRKNPEPLTVIALITAAGVAFWAWMRGQKNKKQTPTKVASPTPEYTEPSGNKYPGLTGKDAADLEFLGYSPSTNGTKKFQKEFNIVNPWLVNQGLPDLLPMTLLEDGVFGDNTRDAAAAAIVSTDEYGVTWMQLVSSAKQNEKLV